MEPMETMGFVAAFKLYELGDIIIESVETGRTFKKEWSNKEFPLDVRQSQVFYPEEIRSLWIISK